MNRNSIFERDHSENAVFNFGNTGPKPDPVVFLCFGPDRIFYDSDTPLFPQIRPLAQNLVLEIGGEAVFRHSERIVRFASHEKSFGLPCRGRKSFSFQTGVADTKGAIGALCVGGL